jgi:cell division protein FtsL
MDMSERITKLETKVESLKEDVGELKSDVKELYSRITTGNRYSYVQAMKRKKSTVT